VLMQQRTIPGTVFEGRSLGGSAIRHIFPLYASGAFGEHLDGPWRNSAVSLLKYAPIMMKCIS
jgi:hypothetical protein